ncbi:MULTISPECIES: hypothetical protein [Pseudomonas]|uniref:hypothetical protein n=1 Tax=Pseudomonas TaxID=286 RepID=UPI000F74C76D|nr:hypothetical protein [Pseudomonas aeruginosa]AZN50004.1 hypothetical protein EJP70_00555 [Pseudomonas aeruginosa]EKW5415283.1 hypothetical protein [Pseudomonas aeruginosa]MBN0213563.1 hypothetical protein [Pseudomonas aeruginosa]MBN0610489.1 hypothetical protein [Pseudomonas aeruginosa]MBN0805158.1 hypothetical protein [Pseudomonas aeruginosa]
MLSPQDDFIGHQTTTTFDHVQSSDPAWMERLWYTGHPRNGEMIFDIGLGYHPNRNVMDVFAGITVGTRQYNFRASRRLRPNPLETAVGPLKIEILQGLRRHRLQLEPNDSGLAFDIEFIASMNAHEEHPHFRRRQGRVTEDMARCQQLGRYQGWFEVEGVRHAIDSEDWLGQRDHSWGIRSEMRSDETHPPVTFYPPFLFAWATVQFAERGLHVFFKERAPGDFIYISGEEVLLPGNKPDLRRRLVDVSDHRIQWADDPHGQTVQSAELDIRLANGVEKTLKIRVLPARYFLKGGLYGGLDGWFQGDDKGALYMEHESWDLTCPETRKRLRTLSDHVIEVRDGDEVGYGIMEYGVGKGYARYPEVQEHPAI